MKLERMTICAAFCGLLLTGGAAEPLAERKWEVTQVSGAAGSMVRQGDGTVLLKKTSDAGILFFHNGRSEFPVEPGKTYRAAVVYKGTSDGAIMLQITGAGRTPFPSAAGKNGVAEVVFTARPGEKNAKLHYVMKRPGNTVIERIDFEAVKLDDNLIRRPGSAWRIASLEGAAGTLSGTATAQTIAKNNEKGYIAFVSRNGDFSLTPGKPYLVSITARRETPDVTMTMMVQMPGAKRSPFPTVGSRKAAGTEETLAYLFVARSDETKIRPHLIVRGKGSIRVTGFTVRELTAAEYREKTEAKKITRTKFDGNALNADWTPFGVQTRGAAGHPFIEFTAKAQGGIGCSKLNWNASKIKALELSFRAADEGGYLDCVFTAEENGRKYASHVGRSVLPDGKWHALLFAVGEDPAWKGTVTSVRFIWNGQDAPLGFASLAATPEINRIHDIRPRGRYELSRLSGKAPSELRLRDRNDRVLKTVRLPADADRVSFAAPEQTMTAETMPAGAPLLLTLREMPKLDLPAAYWRGQWIWSQNGFGPNATNVWFRREFTLREKPSEAWFVGAGDDAYEVFINGRRLGGGADWSQANKFNALDALQAGKNTIVARVYNVQAWGGFLCELYAKVGGKPVYITSGRDWFCHVGGKNQPKDFTRPVMVLGAPPVAPWNSRVGYSYVGPRGEIDIVQPGVNSFTARVRTAPAVDSDKLELKLVTPDWRTRRFSGNITPRTGNWKAGDTVRVTYRIPAQYAPAAVYNASDFLAVGNNASLGSVKVEPKRIPALSSCRIEGAGTRPYFVVNGKKYAPIYYLLSGGFSAFPESRDWMIRNGLAAGCEIFRLYAGFDEFWLGDGNFDFSNLDRRLETAALHAPDAKLILNVKTGMPDWWVARNPDDATAYFGGKPAHKQKDKQALASKNYLRDAAVPLKALIDHIKKSPYADRFIGMAISEGWNSEWFWSDVDNLGRSAISGHSKADYNTFRSYLRERYKTDEALARAWNQPGVTFDTAKMPDDQAWKRGRVGILLDPAKDMALIDWFRFRNRAIGEAIIALCKIVKDETGGKWVAGAYYGYLLAFSNIFNRLQTVGHLDIERVARSPYVDFVTAPSFYTWRFSGQGDAVMQATESFTSHGKLVIVEQDLRTFGETSSYEIRNGMLCTPLESVGALERAFALAMTRGIGTHWLEMYENWFREPLLIEVMRTGKQAYEQLGPVKGTTPVEVTLVSDSESAMFTRLNGGDGLHLASIGEMQRRLSEAGFPFRHVMMRDLLEPGVVPPAKFYVVNNLVMLDAAARSALMRRFEREKATVLWLYAAGLDTPDKGPDVAMMGAFLGPRFEMSEAVDQPVLIPVPGLGVGRARNFNRSAPWFYPVSGFDEVLGRTPDGKPALVRWTLGGATHYFSTLMNLPMPLVRILASRAGTHIYGSSGDPLLIGNDIVALHAKTSGRKQLAIPPGLRARSVFGPAATLSNNSFEAAAGRTYGFLIEKVK